MWEYHVFPLSASIFPFYPIRTITLVPPWNIKMAKIMSIKCCWKTFILGTVKAVSSTHTAVNITNIYHLNVATALRLQFSSSRRDVNTLLITKQTFHSDISRCILIYLMESDQIDVRWAVCNNELPNLLRCSTSAQIKMCCLWSSHTLETYVQYQRENNKFQTLQMVPRQPVRKH